MKKIIILAAAFLCAAQLTKAQTEKGTQTLGIDLSLLHQSSSGTQVDYMNSIDAESTKLTDFSVGPTYSYFIANNLDLGASLVYESYDNDNGITNDLTDNFQRSYSAQLFLRKYFMYSSKFGIRVGPYVGYEKTDTKYTYLPAYSTDNSHISNQSLLAGANLALVYYPAKHLGLSATLANVSYSHFKDNGTQQNDSGNSFNLNFISSGVGVSVFWVFGGI